MSGAGSPTWEAARQGPLATMQAIQAQEAMTRNMTTSLFRTSNAAAAACFVMLLQPDDESGADTWANPSSVVRNGLRRIPSHGAPMQGGRLDSSLPDVALASGALDQPDDHQQDDRADRRIDDRADDAGQAQSQTRQQPAGDKCAEDADDDIANQTEPAALDDLASEPSGNRTDKQ